jgi:hypothetical protein
MITLACSLVSGWPPACLAACAVCVTGLLAAGTAEVVSACLHVMRAGRHASRTTGTDTAP